jgi:hypothetical protein
MTPAPSVDDARFLRRASIDITGRLPEPDRVVKFLADTDPDKRSRAVDELLKSPGYARHWADYWDALLMGRLTREAVIDRGKFKKWLHDEFAANAPWDHTVRELVAAEGWNSNTRPGNVDTDPPDMDSHYAPATNWFLKYQKSLPELSGATSKVFLGVQIQCAQCHDHKTEKWKQEDFRQFTAFFVKTWPTIYDKKLVLGIHRLNTYERWFTPPVEGQHADYFASYKDYVKISPRMLDGSEPTGATGRRKQLAEWMTARENPWFAPAMANRMWALFTGTGFVEPLDDFRSGNPPTLPAALDALAADFRDHGYDVGRLIRVICATEAYQRACRQSGAPATASHDYWSAYPLKALEIEVLYDIVLQATGADVSLGKHGTKATELMRTSVARQFVTQMGTDDMAEVTNFEETIPRALMLLNGALVNGTSRVSPDVALGELVKQRDDAGVIEQLYLRTLSRRPTDAEQSAWKKFLQASRQRVQTAGPPSPVKTGAAAKVVDPQIANAPADADFKELLDHAQSAADFGAMRKRLKNNADGALFVKAYEAWAAEAPFQNMAIQPGGQTPREQALEDVCWALINSTEFLTNH